MKKRIDLGTRIAGDKARMPDEFITKSQLVTPDGNALETLANGDLVVPVATSDHLVLVDELDTNPGTLLDKIYPADSNVTINVVEIEGERVMEIGVIDSGGGLPTGMNGQTLRHDGTDWIANSNINNLGNSVELDAVSPNTLNEAYLEVAASDGGTAIELFSERILFNINGSDNTNKYLRIKDTAGEIEFVEGVTLLQHKVTLSAAQIRTLSPTTYIGILPAPGANKYYSMRRTIGYSTYATASYNIAARLRYENDTSVYVGEFGLYNNNYIDDNPFEWQQSKLASVFINKGLRLYGSATPNQLGEGTLTIILEYTIVDLS